MNNTYQAPRRLIKTPDEIEKMRVAGRLAAEVLDMINDGNLRETGNTNWKEMCEDGRDGQTQQQQQGSSAATSGGGGLKPICKAYGILGFIRFLDCYYLTLITKRAKVGCIGENSIYTVKVRCSYIVDSISLLLENFDLSPLKCAERVHSLI